MLPALPIAIKAAKIGLPIILVAGFFFWINGVISDKAKAEKALAFAQTEIAGLRASQDEILDLINLATVRVEEERLLTEERLRRATAQRVEAEKRSDSLNGELNDLRKILPANQCGIGPDLTNRLRLNRDSRETSRRDRATGGAGASQGRVPTGERSSNDN